jgi:alpha-beta hydrolase superfamily lysophospholipase
MRPEEKTMKIERLLLVQEKEKTIQAVKIVPLKPAGSVVLVHGYGGCKEEELGLAWRIAETGLVVCAIDLCGHGENLSVLHKDMLEELEIAIEHCRQYGKVAAIGHSLGERLSLLSSADYAIGISPALNARYSDTTCDRLETIRSYRVRESSFNSFIKIMGQLPVWHPNTFQPTLIIFGTRDVPEIVQDCRKLQTQGFNVKEIDAAFHNDIYLHEETFRAINKQLKLWLQ